jgi:hypothetical protein
MRNKTDRNDARGIAQILRTGWYSRVHVKSPQSHQIRLLLSSRRAVLSKCVDLENELRGLLRVFGVRLASKVPHSCLYTSMLQVARSYLCVMIDPKVLATRSRSAVHRGWRSGIAIGTRSCMKLRPRALQLQGCLQLRPCTVALECPRKRAPFQSLAKVASDINDGRGSLGPPSIHSPHALSR